MIFACTACAQLVLKKFPVHVLIIYTSEPYGCHCCLTWRVGMCTMALIFKWTNLCSRDYEKAQLSTKWWNNAVKLHIYGKTRVFYCCLAGLLDEISYQIQPHIVVILLNIITSNIMSFSAFWVEFLPDIFCTLFYCSYNAYYQCTVSREIMKETLPIKSMPIKSGWACRAPRSINSSWLQ